jgi:hypothetical protein
MALIDDSSPELGGNLNVNGYAVTDYVNGAIRFGSEPLNDIAIITTNTGAILFQGTSSGGIVGGELDVAAMRLLVSKGSLTAPANTNPGEFLGAWFVSGYHNGNWKGAAGLVTQWQSDADMTTDSPASAIGLVTGGNGGLESVNFAVFDSRGVFHAPVFSATTYATSNLPINPNPGWMVFDHTTNQFKGWNGTEWTILG